MALASSASASILEKMQALLAWIFLAATCLSGPAPSGGSRYDGSVQVYGRGGGLLQQVARGGAGACSFCSHLLPGPGKRRMLLLRGGGEGDEDEAMEGGGGDGGGDLEVLPDFMQVLAKEDEKAEEAGSESSMPYPKGRRATAKMMQDLAEGRNLETEDGAPVVFNLEELADMETPEGVEEIHNVLGRWHEMMNEREKNPFLHLKDHPRYKFVQEVEEFYREAEAFRNETEAEVTEGIRNFTEIPLVKRLMEISPRNLSDPEVEMWPQKMVQSAMDDVTEADIRETIERDGPYRVYGEERVNQMLRRACQSGDVKLIEDLVKSGGNVSHIDPEVPWPPLHWAIIARQYDAIRALIRLGASPSQHAGDALTPIQRACTSQDVESLRLLSSLGGDPSEVGDNGFTALHWAAAYGALDCCQALVELGCDVGAKDVEGKTPRERAQDKDEVETVEWLGSVENGL